MRTNVKGMAINDYLQTSWASYYNVACDGEVVSGAKYDKPEVLEQSTIGPREHDNLKVHIGVMHVTVAICVKRGYLDVISRKDVVM